MWKALGFRESPYDARPLRTSSADVDLLVGRGSEAIRLTTALGSSREGVLVLSGLPGVGKTSFLNVQQYLLSRGKAPFGLRVLPAYELTPIQPADKPRDTALRALNALISSVETYAKENASNVPAQVKEIGKWIRQTAGGGYTAGISILGTGATYGRQTTIPPASNASFEAIRDALNAVVGDTVEAFGFASAVLALDNLDNLDEDALRNLLITFRDTLFLVPRIWWVLIGPSGLASQLHMLDTRIADRLTGTGIELGPLRLEELHAAIAKRVARFNMTTDAKSPLPELIHRELYEASNGEIRFVFRYSAAICTAFVAAIRHTVTEASGRGTESERFATEIAKRLIDKQIPVDLARAHLRELVESEVNGLALKPREREILQKIHGRKEARSSDFKHYSCKSAQEFSSRFLSPLHSRHLLARRQDGSAVYYSLRGLAALGARYKII